MRSDSVYFRCVDAPDDIERCLRIREIVFIDEQGVDASLERDGLDGECIHYIGMSGDIPVAAARIRILDDRFKFQRVAVLKEARGIGIGEALMRFMMADLAKGADAGGRHFFLSSQSHATPFYVKLGFAVCSDEFMDAGIPHRDMRADIATSTRAAF